MTTCSTTNALKNCPDHANDQEIAQFRSAGYLAFANVLDPAELEASRGALRQLTERLAGGSADEVEFSPGRRNDGGNYGGASYKFRDSSCFMQLEPGFDPSGSSDEEIELQVRKYMNFTSEHAALEKIVQPGHRVRGVVESLIGPDPILFQEMALVKPPFVGSEKPWHQDNAYFSVTPLDSIIGVWIALDDATVENGCMHVIPGGHHVGALKHFHSSDCEIVKGRLETERAEAVPVPAGGALFFYGLLPHETPPNRSANRRRALQFHFRAATSRIVDEETYNRIFAEADGTPASCRAASR